MGVGAGDLGRAVAFAPGFWRHLRHRISLEEAERELARRLGSREANFLRMLRDAVYGHPRSPYRSLLEWADCEYGDAEAMVGDRGVEATLEALHDAGVYVTFDEFKGREPIVRRGHRLSPTPDDFNSPLVRPYSFGRSGGSTGPPVRVPRSWQSQRDGAINVMLHRHAHGLLEAKQALWYSTPEVAIQSMISSSLSRSLPDSWFVPPPQNSPWTRRAFVRYFVMAGRVAGVNIPTPQQVSLEEADIVARWAARTRDAEGAAVVSGYMSQMVRVALAASREGLDLSGVTLVGTSEPTTPAKVSRITATGARFVSEYWCNELGALGFGCAQPLDGSDLHLQKDRLGLIQVPQAVPNSDLTVEAFCFTSLLTSAPMILLNTELDDYGVLERRSCGCPMEARGLTEHLRDVRSYRKLTGEGITLVGGAMERILEDVLPARFGGSALDYQLAEEEDEQGLTRLYLLISPGVAVEDEREPVWTVLAALEEGDEIGRSTADLWRQADTLRVRRQEPVRTAAGKLMSLHVAKRPPPDRDAGMAAFDQ